MDETDAGPPAAPDAGACTLQPCAAPSPAPALCQSDCTRFVDIVTRLNLMLNDLKAQDSAETRNDIRYLDLTNYANAGHGAAQLDPYRDALSYALNSLSHPAQVVVPEPVDDQALLFRVRLSAYGWTPALWDRLAGEYPYGVSYDPNSRTFPIDDT